MPDNALYWGGSTSSNDRLWALAAHVSVYLGLPVIGPVIVMLLAKDQPFARYHAIQALALHVALAVLAGVIIPIISFFTCGAGALLYIPLFVGPLIPIWGALKAFGGEWQGYPLLARFGKE